MAGGRAFRPSAPRRAAFAALLTLVLLASLSFLLSSAPRSSSSPRASASSSRLAAVRRHAADHAAVLAAYAAHARKLKEASAAQSTSFSALSSDLSALSVRLASHLALPEDALRPLEKEARERIKLARLRAADAKEGFDTLSKIQKLSDTVFAVGEQLARAPRRPPVLPHRRMSSSPTPPPRAALVPDAEDVGDGAEDGDGREVEQRRPPGAVAADEEHRDGDEHGGDAEHAGQGDVAVAVHPPAGATPNSKAEDLGSEQRLPAVGDRRQATRAPQPAARALRWRGHNVLDEMPKSMGRGERGRKGK